MKSGWLLSTVAASAWKFRAGWPESRLAWVIRTTPVLGGGSGADMGATARAVGSLAIDGAATDVPITAVASTATPAATRRAEARRRGRGRWWTTGKIFLSGNSSDGSTGDEVG